jgi:hypothetical protein
MMPRGGRHGPHETVVAVSTVSELLSGLDDLRASLSGVLVKRRHGVRAFPARLAVCGLHIIFWESDRAMRVSVRMPVL